MEHALALPRPAGLLRLAIGLGAAAVLAWLAWDVNLRRACTLNDSPDLPVCPAGADAPGAAQLRERIARNPGDTAAYVQLALRELPAGRPQALAAAERLAPNHPQVLLLRASQALDRRDWPAATALLVPLAEHHHNAEAARALALLAGAGQADALVARVTPGSRWVREVLAQLPQAQVPFSAVVPLVVQAWRQKVLGDAELQGYVRDLKAAGAWTDAYALWLALHGGSAPLLFNGGFEQPFEAGGFDWEPAEQPPARAGMVLSLGSAEGRGSVLELRFTGRPLPVPLLRQQVFLGPGRYRLHGQYQAPLLRMENGLAWVLQCPGKGVEPQRSTALVARPAGWRDFDFDFAVPANCGPVASLQLETAATFEARTGGRGAIQFDALSLRQLP